MEKYGEVNTRAGLTWQIALLAGPLVLQNMSQTLLGVVDTYFVSRISTEALAAVGLSSVMFLAVMILFKSTANSTVVFVGRAHGEGDNAKIGRAVWRSLNMVAWLSLIVLALPWLFSNLMAFASPSDSPNVGELGTRYLQIRAFEIPLVMFSAVTWAFLVGRGDSRTPMILAWITVLLNILLDWVLVLGNLGAPMLGVSGAAYATVIANIVNAVLSAGILWSSRNRRAFDTGRMQLVAWPELRKALKIGLPLGLGDFVEIASFSAFFALIARLGTDVLAANQIALQYMSVSFTFGFAVNMATSSLVAQYLGAKKPDTAEKVGYRACMLAMAGMGLIGLSYLIAPASLISVFNSEPSVITAGVTILRLVALYQILDAVGIVLAGALNGAGDTQFTMIARMVFAWGIFIPLVWILIFPLDLGIWGAWLGALIYLGGLSAIYFLRFRSGRWKTIELFSPDDAMETTPDSPLDSGVHWEYCTIKHKTHYDDDWTGVEWFEAEIDHLNGQTSAARSSKQPFIRGEPTLFFDIPASRTVYEQFLTQLEAQDWHPIPEPASTWYRTRLKRKAVLNKQ